MEILVDTHTHTVSSGHAYSTVQEMAKEASVNGIKAFAITDHGPKMLGAPSLYHFGNLHIIPEELYGIRVIKGVEANIIDYSGQLDVPDLYLGRLEFVIASFHDICIHPSTVENHTQALVNVLKNPWVDAVAHPGNPQFQVDIEKVVRAAKEYGKFIEINNHSFVVRKGSEENCRMFVEKCKEIGTRIVCGSDAHMSFQVGKLDRVKKILQEVGISQDLVINTSLPALEEYLRCKKEKLGNV